MSSRTRAAYRMRCPHCGGWLKSQNTKYHTDFYRTSYVICQNDNCRAVFEASHELIRQIDSGDNPNPDVQMPNVCKAAISQPQPATPKTTKE